MPDITLFDIPMDLCELAFDEALRRLGDPKPSSCIIVHRAETVEVARFIAAKNLCMLLEIPQLLKTPASWAVFYNGKMILSEMPF